MGIEPTHQLFTGTLVLKGIKSPNQRSANTYIYSYIPLIVKGFPVFHVSVYVGLCRGLPAGHRHKKGMISCDSINIGQYHTVSGFILQHIKNIREMVNYSLTSIIFIDIKTITSVSEECKDERYA